MHIEPGVVDGAKITLSYVTAIGSFGLAGKMAMDSIRKDGGVPALVLRSMITTGLVFCFFELLPHYGIGVSEVHLILGSTLLLMFGPGAAAIGLAMGLLAQGALIEHQDLPQYGMNVTTLIVPLYGISLLAHRIIPSGTAYVNLKYGQALALSTAFQGGIVVWVAFWAFYGHGFSAGNIAAVSSFGVAYMSVILVEPLIDLVVLAAAKSFHRASRSLLFAARLHRTV